MQPRRSCGSCLRKRVPDQNDPSGYAPGVRKRGQENQACWGAKRYKSRSYAFTLPLHQGWSDCLPQYEDGEPDTRGVLARAQPVEDESEPERAEEDHDALGKARKDAADPRQSLEQAFNCVPSRGHRVGLFPRVRRVLFGGTPARILPSGAPAGVALAHICPIQHQEPIRLPATQPTEQWAAFGRSNALLRKRIHVSTFRASATT